MGRWTPLILMAGGLAILLGTLLGINFPMDGRNAEVPTGEKKSQVLPANINVNSTATGSSGESSVAQNSNNNQRTVQSAPTTTAQGDTTESTTPVGQTRSRSRNNAPIRALW